MKKPGFWILVILISISAVHVFADGKKKKTSADRTAWNPYSCCHRMDEIEHRQVTLVENYMAPEFFSFDTIRAGGDTSFVFECYDGRDSILCKDTLHDFEKVRYVSLFKNFTDHLHTYNDKDRKEKPLPVSVIVKRYDKMGSDKWMNISYPGNKFVTLKEFKNDIVKIDSFQEIDTTTRTTIISIYKYYKVAAIK